jgi:HEAT repeat protein
MIGLLGHLQREFENRNEDCAIVIEPSISNRDRGRASKPDAIILKDNNFVLIDLKAFDGHIIADCKNGATWKSKDGRRIQPPRSQNPFAQASFHRLALIDFLTQFVHRDNAPVWASLNDSTMQRWIVRRVHSWVVTAEGSMPEVTGINLRENPGFKVLSLERVTNALAFLRSEEPLMSQTETRHFLDALMATISNVHEWYRGESGDGRPQNHLMIPRISDLIDAGELGSIANALKQIRDLDLRAHLTHVIRVWQDKRYPGLRKEALSILIDWQYGRLGNILDEGLREEDLTITGLVLDHLSSFGYPETFPTLIRMLEQGPTELRVKVINAISASGHGSACSALLDFIQSNLSNKPFREFQHWTDRIRESIHEKMERSKREELNRLEAKRTSLHETCRAVINSLGDLDCKKSIPWLKRIMEEPTYMGFETDDYKELERVHSDYFGVFANVCKSLGKVGIGDSEVTKLLLGRLNRLPDDYQDDIIIALGNLGDPTAGAALLPFIADSRGHLYGHTVSALSKMHYVEAFGPLAEQYLADPENGSGIWTGEALANIDVRRFEEVLLHGVGSDVNTEKKIMFLRALLPIASLRSVDSLFALLGNPELSYMATWILSNLSAYPEVFNKAMDLVKSNNPLLQASAIEILRDKYTGNLDALSEFEKNDPSIVLLRTVTSIYAETGSLNRLLKYADHPDEEVRSNVFHVFRERHGSDHVDTFVSSDSGIAGNCSLVIDKEGIAIKLEDRVLFLPKETISRAMLTQRTEVDRHGVYFRVKTHEIDEAFLVVHHAVYGHSTRELALSLLDDIKAIVGSNLGGSELGIDEAQTLALLWRNVPSNGIKQSDRAA